VIAEGVETEEQMELLKKLGCDIIQGYYFSKPLSPEEFGALIEKELR
ncbi:MAG: EAL domain-containing protein, partial [Ruminococcus sp.]|nr:EAL domain-containing protein [Ruminococcus sp.]